MHRILRVLVHPRLPLPAALFGVLLGLPALWSDLYADDWIHWSTLHGVGSSPAAQHPLFQYFAFVDLRAS
jgi:hypothetical protein